MHWSNDYVGKPYVIDEYDCLHLVLDVMVNSFGHDIEVDIEREKKLINKSEQIRANIDKFVTPIDASEAVDGDVMLMQCKNILNHTGILAEVNNVKYVVHNLRNVKSVAIHRVRDLDKWDITVEGYYRFNA